MTATFSYALLLALVFGTAIAAVRFMDWRTMRREAAASARRKALTAPLEDMIRRLSEMRGAMAKAGFQPYPSLPPSPFEDINDMDGFKWHIPDFRPMFGFCDGPDGKQVGGPASFGLVLHCALCDITQVGDLIRDENGAGDDSDICRFCGAVMEVF